MTLFDAFVSFKMRQVPYFLLVLTLFVSDMLEFLPQIEVFTVSINNYFLPNRICRCRVLPRESTCSYRIREDVGLLFLRVSLVVLLLFEPFLCRDGFFPLLILPVELRLRLLLELFLNLGQLPVQICDHEVAFIACL